MNRESGGEKRRNSPRYDILIKGSENLKAAKEEALDYQSYLGKSLLVKKNYRTKSVKISGIGYSEVEIDGSKLLYVEYEGERKTLSIILSAEELELIDNIGKSMQIFKDEDQITVQISNIVFEPLDQSGVNIQVFYMYNNIKYSEIMTAKSILSAIELAKK
jgi:hypothetical protein